jgi:hypothetical protein
MTRLLLFFIGGRQRSVDRGGGKKACNFFDIHRSIEVEKIFPIAVKVIFIGVLR